MLSSKPILLVEDEKIDFKLLSELQESIGSGKSEKEIELLQEYPWKGNIRELRNVMERVTLLIEEDELRVNHLQVCPHYNLFRSNSENLRRREWQRRFLLDLCFEQ